MNLNFFNTATKDSVETSKNQATKRSKKNSDLDTEKTPCDDDCYEQINMTSFKKSFSKLHHNYLSEN